jgi:hypothetical protein
LPALQNQTIVKRLAQVVIQQGKNIVHSAAQDFMVVEQQLAQHALQFQIVTTVLFAQIQLTQYAKYVQHPQLKM